MRLAAEGYRVKIPSQTPLEYSGDIPVLKEFARPYTRLYYRERSRDDEALWESVHAAYRDVLSRARDRGPAALARRTFSLRGLYYQW